jgi:hypothetical protein
MGPDFLAARVIAEQYSSSNFFPLHFYYHKGKFGTPLKMVSLRLSASLKKVRTP